MAAADSLDAKPTAFENAVFENRLDHILTAGGCEAACRRGKRRDKDPVEIDGKEENFSNENLPFYRFAIFVRALHTAFSMTE